MYNVKYNIESSSLIIGIDKINKATIQCELEIP